MSHDEEKRFLGLKISFFTFMIIFHALALSSIFGILHFGGAQLSLKWHVGSVFGVFFITQFFIYQKIKNVQRKNYMICNMLQNYAQESQDIAQDFEEPKKNILKSFESEHGSISKTAVAVTQITSMIEKTKEQINDCKDIITQSEEKVEHGKEVMEQLKNSIIVIKQATKDMDMTLKIINEINIKSSVITEIVAKTELLAMNASIEAARAGDFGKGFAVVSEEVGDLARNSGKSAKKIKDLLNESSMKVTQVLRTTDERIKEGELICKQVVNAFDNIHQGIFLLKEQANILFAGTEMQHEIVVKSSLSVENVNQILEKSKEIVKKIETSMVQVDKQNELLFFLAERMIATISGDKVALLAHENRYSKVKRTIFELDA